MSLSLSPSPSSVFHSRSLSPSSIRALRFPLLFNQISKWSNYVIIQKYLFLLVDFIPVSDFKWWSWLFYTQPHAFKEQISTAQLRFSKSKYFHHFEKTYFNNSLFLLYSQWIISTKLISRKTLPKLNQLKLTKKRRKKTMMMKKNLK